MINKCAICGFDVSCAEHHIIPTYAGGSNSEKNKIFLCPNHHSEAHKGERSNCFIIFNKKYNLTGECFSAEYWKLLCEISKIVFLENSNETKKILALYFMLKIGIKQRDLISYLTGVSNSKNIITRYNGGEECEMDKFLFSQKNLLNDLVKTNKILLNPLEQIKDDETRINYFLKLLGVINDN